MMFYRFCDLNNEIDGDCQDDFWVCEDCLYKVPENYDYLDRDIDELGDHVCDYCGLYFDHDEMEYVT